MKRILITCVLVSPMLFSGCIETYYESTADVTVSSPQLDGGAEASNRPADPLSDESAAIVFGSKFPRVLAAEAAQVDNGDWRFSVTLSSLYDSPERYADAWRVLDEMDHQLGIRVLGHDHSDEQPFTRSGTIQIPKGTGTVFIEGRDQLNGWSGQRFEIKIPTP